MNFANKLTMFRIFLVIPFILILNSKLEMKFLYSVIIFIIASITDFFDGYIARKYNLTTDFGKLMDPLADKILVFSCLICFVEMKLATSIPLIIMISREFLVSGIRLISASNNKVISANFFGKLKTFLQMIFIILILFLKHFSYIYEFNFDVNFVSRLLIWFLSLVTVLSAYDYIYENRNIFK